MSILAENIVIFWLIPVLAQIVLPLGVLLVKGGQVMFRRLTGTRKITEPDLEEMSTVAG